MAITALLSGCGSDAVIDSQTDPNTFDNDVTECGAPLLCPLLSWQSYAPPNPPSLPSQEAHDCALAALSDRTPSLLAASYGCEGGCSGTLFLIRSDGTALSQSWTQVMDGGLDLGGVQAELSDWASGGQQCNLLDPSFYDTCDSSLDGDCDDTSEWFVDCADETAKRCVP